MKYFHGKIVAMATDGWGSRNGNIPVICLAHVCGQFLKIRDYTKRLGARYSSSLSNLLVLGERSFGKLFLATKFEEKMGIHCAKKLKASTKNCITHSFFVYLTII
jgi:hypothetical protein